MSPDLERLIGRAVTDKAFRDKLLDPKQTDQAIKDFNLSSEEVKRVKEAAEATTPDQLEQQFDTRGAW